jgi:hypothetical protein
LVPLTKYVKVIIIDLNLYYLIEDNIADSSGTPSKKIIRCNNNNKDTKLYNIPSTYNELTV